MAPFAIRRLKVFDFPDSSDFFKYAQFDKNSSKTGFGNQYDCRGTVGFRMAHNSCDDSFDLFAKP